MRSRYATRSFRTALFLSCVASLAIIHNRPAFAADADTDRARALFEEAGELERHGQWSAAQERLRAALRLRETPQLHYALGWALENDDKLLDAKTEYEAVIRIAREKPNTGSDEATRLATARLIDLDKKMPVVKVRVVGGAKASSHVIVDGREIKRGEDDVATTQVNPGSHVIRVERGTDSAIEQMVYVGRSTVRTVDVDAGAADAPPTAVAARDTTQYRHGKSASLGSPHAADKSSANVVPWVLLSGGLAFVAGGAALLVSASSDADKRDANQAQWCTATACNGSAATRPETAEATAYRRGAEDATSAGNTKQAIGFALGGVGIVSAIVGTILLVRGDSDGAQERRAHASAAPIQGGAFGSVDFAF